MEKGWGPRRAPRFPVLPLDELRDALADADLADRAALHEGGEVVGDDPLDGLPGVEVLGGEGVDDGLRGGHPADLPLGEGEDLGEHRGLLRGHLLPGEGGGEKTDLHAVAVDGDGGEHSFLLCRVLFGNPLDSSFPTFIIIVFRT